MTATTAPPPAKAEERVLTFGEAFQLVSACCVTAQMMVNSKTPSLLAILIGLAVGIAARAVQRLAGGLRQAAAEFPS